MRYKNGLPNPELGITSYDLCTEDEQKFIDIYVIYGNSQKSLKEACPHIFDTGRTVIQFMRRQRVKDAIADARAQLSKRYEVTHDNLAFELAAIAKSNIKDLFKSDGTLKNVNDLPDYVASAISSVKVTTNILGEVTTEIKYWDKIQAIKILGTHIGMFDDRGRMVADNELAGMSEEELDEELVRLRNQAPRISLIEGGT